MAEILTESFCERCGTRYTFETPAGPSGRLSGVRVLGKGLKKLALTRAGSLDEAIDLARADDEREAAERQIEAFQGTFSFCLSCRQYTCPTCWNEAAGSCLSCAPTPESEAAERELADREARARALADEQAAARAAAMAQEAAEREAAARVQAEEEAAGREALARALAKPRRDDDRTPAPPPSGMPAVGAAEAVAEPPAPAEGSRAEGSTRQTGRLRARLQRRAASDPAHAANDSSPLAAIDSGSSGAATTLPDPGAALVGFAPGMSLDDAIAAYEAALPAPTSATPGDAEAPALTTEGLFETQQEAPAWVVQELEAEAGFEDRLIRQAAEAALAQPLVLEPLSDPDDNGFAAELDDDSHAATAATWLQAVDPEDAGREADSAPARTLDAPYLSAGPLPAAAEPAMAEPAARELAATEALPAGGAGPTVTAASPLADVATSLPPPAEPFGAWPVAPTRQPAAPLEPLAPAARAPEPVAASMESGTPDGPAVEEDPRLAAWRMVAPEVAPRPAWRQVPSSSAAPAVLAGATAGVGRPSQAPKPAGGAPALAAQACVKCGLSLSATARFCRRCGTRQG